MKLQWKLFIILLIFSVVPLLLVNRISRKSTARLGEALSTDTTAMLEGMVGQELQNTAEGYGVVTYHAKKGIELGVLNLAQEAKWILAGEQPEFDRIYFAEDFDDPVKSPPDLAPMPQYTKRLKNGLELPSPVSYTHPVFYIAPGADREALRSQAERLTGLMPIFKRLMTTFNSDFYRGYVSLESGLHVAYPGHGGYPEGFDPRKRPYYQKAPKDGHVGWSNAIIDVATGKVLFTASVRITDDDGRFLGVASMDVPIEGVLREDLLYGQWSEQLRSFLVVSETNPKTGQPGLLILAEKGMFNAQKKEPLRWLQSDDQDGLGALIQALKNRKTGHLEMSLEGVDSLWAYTSIEQTLGFIVVVPRSVVQALPQRASQKVLDLTQRQTLVVGVTTFVLLLAIVVMAYAGSKSVTRPLTMLVGAWNRVARGDFSVRLRHRFNDERDLVIKAFNQMIPQLEQYVQMTRTLELAKEVQQSLLPRTTPVLPGFQVAGSSAYCEQTGGDYYDVFALGREDTTRFAVVVGDVSGHGVPSALLMATARALIRLRSSQPGEAAAIIEDVNRQLSLDAENTGQFMTLFYGVFDSRNKTVQYVRAGHDPAMVYDPVEDRFTELKGPGIAMGLDENYRFEESRQDLATGQVILIGTDGIWEMHNGKGEMFGKKRLRSVVRTSANLSAGEIMAAITAELKVFRGDFGSEDDVTMVVVKVA
jgi:sigma-B regulation protein RsbU (phosphoserine phosphatase)